MSLVNHDDYAHLKIPLESILTATNNFNEENVIEKADLGNVYRGHLLWSGELIEIDARRFNKDEWDDEKEQEFWLEISLLSSLKHKNLVSLVGFCDENDEKIIIIKLEINFSLENYLSDTMTLTWVQRLEICVGVANALSYIHYEESRDFSVIHRNIDSETILLNDNWEPKLSEFRLSMKIEASERHRSFCVDEVTDSEGYTDPAYIKTNTVSHKSDIYSFGIVMFELLCGRKSIIHDESTNKYLAQTAILHYREEKLNEIIYWDLQKQIDPLSLNVFAETAYACLNEEQYQRPNIDEIVTRLEKALELASVNKHIMSSLKDDLVHLQIPLENILSATNNFNEENFIGKDDLGNLYRGQLLWSGALIDIDARRWLSKYRDAQNEQKFWVEISMLSSLKHKNLVSLVGFCDENGEKIIITRYETRLSLNHYLSDPMLLPWVRRLEISVGFAHALSYIYYDEPRDFSVIHRDIGSSTVLLNDDWEPKLSNFEYSMKIKASQRHNSFHTYRLEYMNGYGDPTYIETKSVNHKSDIYSFGIVLFELLYGREALIDNRLASLAITDYREKKLSNIIDPELWKQIDLYSFNKFAEIAYECLDEERSRRPNIDDIVPRLEKALELARKNMPIHSPPNHLAHLRIPLEDIESATNNFDEKNVIGTGGFGKRYDGQLSWSGELIDITAQRLINKEWDDEKEQQFWTEISMLSSLKHKNLVSVVGFCNEVGAETIIYKDVYRGRLETYLNISTLLTWVKRLEISVGVAHALSYIHYDESRDFSVIHRNVDSETILLDENWEPTLWEFQHSMKIKASERNHTFHTDDLVWSTKGYTDPTYIETKSVNHKSDIYSFGIVLFELLCGRKAVSDDQDNKYLAPVAIFHYREKTLDGLIDSDLWKQIDPQSFNVFAKTAYDCLNEERSQRPNIYEIVTRLEKALKLQLERENVEHSVAGAEVEGTSCDNEKGSVAFASIGNESQVSKNTKSFLKDLSHLKISYQDLESVFSNFDEENIINEDKMIFKGRLLQSGQFIDIFGKAYHVDSEKDEIKMFWMELLMLSSLKHKNLVSPIGFFDWGDDQESKAIVYKWEANGSLKKYLSDRTLTWMQRLKICTGVANALSYIHYDAGRDFSVIHCNVRSSKILLDDKWEPKLCGFELSLKITIARRHRLILTRDIIKNVYLDPKYKMTGGMTHKSDVYSFGVVLFEVLCGRSAVLPDEELEEGLLSQLDQ